MLFRHASLVFALLAAGSLGVDATANMLQNPGFELPDLVPPDNQAPGADDWETFNTAGVRTAQSRTGDQSLRLAPSAPTGTADGIARQEFSAAPNDVLTFGTWVLNPSSDPLTGTRKAQLRLQWLNASDTLINQTVLNIADADTPTDLWINFKLVDLVLPDNPNITTVRPSLFVTNDGGTGGGVVFLDDVEFTNSSSIAVLPEPGSLGVLGAISWAVFVRRPRR